MRASGRAELGERAVQEFAGGLVGAGCWAHAEGKEVGRRVGAGLGRVRGIGLGFWVGSSFSISFVFLIQTTQTI